MHLKMSSGKWRPFCLGLNVWKELSTRVNRTHWLKMYQGIIYQKWRMKTKQSLAVVLAWVTNISCIDSSPLRYRYREVGNHDFWMMFLQIIIKLNTLLVHLYMMASSNGNNFRVAVLVCREFNGHRWIPHTKASDAELWCFLWSVSEPTVEQTIQTPVIWDTSSCSLCSHCNASGKFLVKIYVGQCEFSNLHYGYSYIRVG